jgi:hypothetical protein
MFSGKHGSIGIFTAPTLIIIFKYENIKIKKERMPSGRCLTSKLYDNIIKRPSISHETIPLRIKFYTLEAQISAELCNTVQVI